MKHQPSYRVVAADKESPRDGKFLEILGHYNPRTEPFTFRVHEDRVYDWLSKGAQPSDSVRQLFQSVGLWDRYERFKSGEDMETLMEEAEAEYTRREANPKTNPNIP
jgi:small subunit ribosomal protein S16